MWEGLDEDEVFDGDRRWEKVDGLCLMLSSNLTLKRCGVVLEGVVFGVSNTELLVSESCRWYSAKALSCDGDRDIKATSQSVSDDRDDLRGEVESVVDGVVLTSLGGRG